LHALFDELLTAGLAEEAVEAARAMTHAFSTHGHAYFQRLIDAGAFGTAIRSFQELGEPWEILTKAIPILPPSLLEEALNQASMIDDHSTRGAVLVAICSRPLSGGTLGKAISVVASLSAADYRAKALAAISRTWTKWAQEDTSGP
jgi:hypothetical protein